MYYPVYYRNIFHLGTALLCSIVCFPEIYSTHEMLLSSAEIKSTLSSQNSSSEEFFPVLKTYTGCFIQLRIWSCCFRLKSMNFSLQFTSQRSTIFLQSYAVSLWFPDFLICTRGLLIFWIFHNNFLNIFDIDVYIFQYIEKSWIYFLYSCMCPSNIFNFTK